MKNLLKNWRVVLLVLLLVASFLLVSFKGLDLGVDFRGGTLFQIHLSEPASPEQMAAIERTIQQRLDWTGLKDTKVAGWGEEFVVAQTAESDPERVEELEALLKKQGRFEATLDGETLFTGRDIKHLPRDPAQGYGFSPGPDGQLTRWSLPFFLSDAAAQRFSRMAFHQCTAIGFAAGTKQFDCKHTYFFIDRPLESFLVVQKDVFNADRQLLLQGNPAEDIPPGVDIDDLLLNAGTPVLYTKTDGSFAEGEQAKLAEYKNKFKLALVPETLPVSTQTLLENEGFAVKPVPVPEISSNQTMGEFGTTQLVLEGIPWVWRATGVRSVIALTPGVTGLEPFIQDVERAETFNPLLISGTASSQEEAQQRLKELQILLESGSLPISVDNVSKETISGSLGEEFLQQAFLIGVVALLVVAAVLFIRYRKLKLAAPIVFTGLAEVYLILGFAVLINWKLDLAAVAGILAAVGTGVDDQIIITDELLRGERSTQTGFVQRIKRAFFMIMAAALTTVAAMSPIIFYNFGFGKLVGFAITTIVGVLIGVTISRPAYGEIARYLLQQDEK